MPSLTWRARCTSVRAASGPSTQKPREHARTCVTSYVVENTNETTSQSAVTSSMCSARQAHCPLREQPSNKRKPSRHMNCLGKEWTHSCGEVNKARMKQPRTPHVHASPNGMDLPVCRPVLHGMDLPSRRHKKGFRSCALVPGSLCLDRTLTRLRNLDAKNWLQRILGQCLPRRFAWMVGLIPLVVLNR